MSLYPDITFNWNGESVTFTPNMRWCASMEAQGLSPVRIGAQWAMGLAPDNSVALLLGDALRSAGVDVTDEDVVQAITYDRVKVRPDIEAFLSGILPPAPKGEAKNSKGRRKAKT